MSSFDTTRQRPGVQLCMTGDDWTSERDKKAQARAEAQRKTAALVCARKLDQAADALHAFLMACIDCNDASGSRGADDGRVLLQRSMREYSSYLESVYDK